jgi:hypothetical protein
MFSTLFNLTSKVSGEERERDDQHDLNQQSKIRDYREQIDSNFHAFETAVKRRKPAKCKTQLNTLHFRRMEKSELNLLIRFV